MNWIFCLTLCQDSFASFLREAGCGPFKYPDPTNPKDTPLQIQRLVERNPGIGRIAVILDTASISPEMARDHFFALKKLQADDSSLDMLLCSHSGDDPMINGVTHFSKADELKQLLAKDPLKKIA